MRDCLVLTALVILVLPHDAPALVQLRTSTVPTRAVAGRARCSRVAPTVGSSRPGSQGEEDGPGGLARGEGSDRSTRSPLTTCSGQTRRQMLLRVSAVITAGLAAHAAGAADHAAGRQTYFQRFPTLFAPLFGKSTKQTVRRELGDGIWVLEQNLELGPLETPIRSVVVRLSDGTLWVHCPLAPTLEYFELVESCVEGGRDSVAHVVVPTYALEHKVFAKDALARWRRARLWTAPGQFSFPVASVPDEFVWGRRVDGVLEGSDLSTSTDEIPWVSELQFETLTAGTFSVGLSNLTFHETIFYHAASRSLIVTDCVARIAQEPPALMSSEKLLLIGKRSTADALPADSPEARQVGWEKTALLVSYFFPEHEELDPVRPGVVTWTEGWHDNFKALAGRLLVPPVVRALIYAQNPARVQEWVDRVGDRRWEFEQIIPAHWEAPVRATQSDFSRAFAFLGDDSLDAFPTNDLKRGIKPLADAFVRQERR